jgi:hypothetical protein
LTPPRSSRPRAKPPRKAKFLKAARDDVRRLAEDDKDLATLALRKVRELEARTAEGVPLEEMAVTGDLGDCRKLYFGPGDPPSHRIVYRELGEEEGIEILEVVAVEAREDLYAYLLAAKRLGRLPVESEPRFHRQHQAVIQRRAQQRARKRGDK